MDFQSAKRVLAALEPSGTFHLDILTRLGEAFHFEDLETQRVPFEELSVTVVTPSTLYRMKKGTFVSRTARMRKRSASSSASGSDAGPQVPEGRGHARALATGPETHPCTAPSLECGTWSAGRAPHYPPGVYKHRSLEDMNRLDEEWAKATSRGSGNSALI